MELLRSPSCYCSHAVPESINRTPTFVQSARFNGKHDLFLFVLCWMLTKTVRIWSCFDVFVLLYVTICHVHTHIYVYICIYIYIYTCAYTHIYTYMTGKANCVAFIEVCILFRAYGQFVRYRARAYDNMYLIYKYLVQGNLRCLFLHACEFFCADLRHSSVCIGRKE